MLRVLSTSLVLVALQLPARAQQPQIDSLPSWNEGPTKAAIFDFVRRVTTPGPDFIAPADRIAVFDNDGTLWAEQPPVQLMFVRARIEALAAQDPALRQRQPFKAALAGDHEFFRSNARALEELLAATSANMTDEAYQSDVRQFFRTARHPTLHVPYTQVVYRPMVELLRYLRDHGFATYISSGGGIDFIRVVSESIYGIPPPQVIGSSIRKGLREHEGRYVLWREPGLGPINDKAEKPVNIDLHVGKHPVFAAGNVRSGGDVAMLRYTQSRPGPSFQLMINHDDAKREFAYREKDDASLEAARQGGWTVVSIKRDWRRVFVPPPLTAESR